MPGRHYLVLGTFKKLSYKSGTGIGFQADIFPGKWQGIGTGKGRYILYLYIYLALSQVPY
jgi:hypothetical protein